MHIMHRALMSPSRTVLSFLYPSLHSRSAATVANKLRNRLGEPDSSHSFPAKLDVVRSRIRERHHIGTKNHLTRFNTSIKNTRAALDRQNVPEVLRCLEEMRDMQDFHLLQSDFLENASCFLAASFERDNLPEYAWTPSHINVTEELALLAAESGFPGALRQCLFVHLQNHNSNRVLALYSMFKEHLGAKNAALASGINSLEEDYDSDLLSSESIQTNLINHSLDGVVILLSVVTAHAINDTFRLALQACLDTTIRFHHFTTRSFLSDLDFDPSLQSKVRQWVDRLSLARMASRPPSLVKHITRISEGKQVRKLEDLYSSFIAAIEGQDPFIAADPSHVTAVQTVALTDAIWTSFLSAFMDNNCADLAAKLWDDVDRLQVPRTISLWNTLLEHYGRQPKLAIAETRKTWSMMKEEGIHPDALTYRAMISAAFNGHQPRLAVDIFKAFREDLDVASSPSKTVTVYNTMIKGLLQSRKHAESLNLLDTMESQGPQPDIITYNTYLTWYSQRKDLRNLVIMINRMSKKVSCDVFSFSAILTCLLARRRSDAWELVNNLMEKQGVKANSVIYTSIIKEQLKQAGEAGLESAMATFRAMEATGGKIAPTIVTYTTILAALCRLGYDPLVEERKNFILERIRKNGVKLNLRAYNLLIAACLDRPDAEAVQEALKYYRAISELGLSIPHSTYYVLLSALIERGELDVAKDIVEDIKKRTKVPLRGVLLHMMKQVGNRSEQREY